MSRPERGENPSVSPAPRSILERRLVIVTGKGGTGKTSVVAALALAAQRAGLRVCVVETGRDEHVPQLLEPGAGPSGHAGRELRPGLSTQRIDPFEALAEYLSLQLGIPGMRRMLRNPGFQKLLEAAPGWRELITLGKVWHLRSESDARGPGATDLILVDAPATGHGLTFLDVPSVVVSAVRTGPLRRHAGWVEAMVKDPDETLLVPVALAEELPARETAELVRRVVDEVGVAVDRVVVNAVPPAPFPAGLEDLDERLARMPEPEPTAGLPSKHALAACAHHLRERHALAREYVDRIREWTGLPISELPLIEGGVNGPTDLEPLANALAGVPT